MQPNDFPKRKRKPLVWLLAALGLSFAMLAGAYGVYRAQVSAAAGPARSQGAGALQHLRALLVTAHGELLASGSRVNEAVVRAAEAHRVHAGDDAISAAVSDALAATQSDDLGALKVHTKGGTVTLTGTAASQDLRARAVLIAQNVRGVRNVINLVAVPMQAG